MQKTSFVSGDWNAICDICGFKFKASQLRENWKGQRVCADDWEPQHPQMFLRARTEVISTAWARPDEVVVITTNTSDPGIAADLVNVNFTFDASGGAFSVALPAANDSAFQHSEVIYVLNNVGATGNVTVTSASSITGSTTILPGTSAKFQGSFSQNNWRRL